MPNWLERTIILVVLNHLVRHTNLTNLGMILDIWRRNEWKLKIRTPSIHSSIEQLPPLATNFVQTLFYNSRLTRIFFPNCQAHRNSRKVTTNNTCCVLSTLKDKRVLYILRCVVKKILCRFCFLFFIYICQKSRFEANIKGLHQNDWSFSFKKF